MSIRRRIVRAFTLLEVLLTLAMSVVLMGLIGTAFQFYAVDMNVRNMDIQQTSANWAGRRWFWMLDTVQKFP